MFRIRVGSDVIRSNKGLLGNVFIKLWQKGRSIAKCKRNLKISGAKFQNFFILAVSDLYQIGGARFRIRNSATRSTGTWYLRNVTQFPQVPVAVRHLFFTKISIILDLEIYFGSVMFSLQDSDFFLYIINLQICNSFLGISWDSVKWNYWWGIFLSKLIKV